MVNITISYKRETNNSKNERVAKLIEGDNSPTHNLNQGYYARNQYFRQVNFTRYHGFREFGKRYRYIKRMISHRNEEIVNE